MKAIRVHAAGGPEALTLDDIPAPSPKAGEALVKVDAAGLNYIDVYFRTGMYKAELPLTIGTSIVPSGRWYCSMMAIIVRGSANPEPFRVCTKRGRPPCAGRNRMLARRA